MPEQPNLKQPSLLKDVETTASVRAIDPDATTPLGMSLCTAQLEILRDHFDLDTTENLSLRIALHRVNLHDRLVEMLGKANEILKQSDSFYLEETTGTIDTLLAEAKAQ